MLNFYLIILGASGIYLLVQLVAYLFYDRIFFRNTGIMFEEKADRFEWQTVFPKNLLLLVIFLFSSSLFGLLLTVMDVAGWLSMPLGAIGGLAVNFTVNTVIIPLFNKHAGSGVPTDEQLEGMDAVVLVEITAEDYGRIEVTRGKCRYTFDALSANGRTLSVGESVVVIHAQEGLCFIEARERLYDVLFDDEDQIIDE